MSKILLYAVPKIDVYGKPATLTAELDTKRGLIRIKEITENGYRLPYCPTGYPCIIFIGKTKNALRKAIHLANTVASINLPYQCGQGV